MKAVAEYTAKELAALASTLNIAGRSAMKKAELYAEISERLDNCHALALVMDATLYKPVPEPVVDIETLWQELEIYTDKLNMADVLAGNGWKRLPRRLKKSYKAAGLI